MVISLRRYQSKDRPQLLAGLSELQDYLAQLDPAHRLRPRKDFDTEDYLQATENRIRESRGMVLMAENESGNMLGFIIGILPEKARVDEVDSYPGQHGKIIEFYVQKEARRQGVGQQLMKALEKEFRKEGCAFAEVECLAFNSIGHTFYKKNGYEDRLILLSKKL